MRAAVRKSQSATRRSRENKSGMVRRNTVRLCNLVFMEIIALRANKSARILGRVTGARAALPQNCPRTQFRGFGPEKQENLGNRLCKHRWGIAQSIISHSDEITLLITKVLNSKPRIGSASNRCFPSSCLFRTFPETVWTF